MNNALSDCTPGPGRRGGFHAGSSHTLLDRDRAMLHQREMGLRHREPQPILRGCGDSGGGDRDCGLPGAGGPGADAATVDGIFDLAYRAGIRAVSGAHRERCADGLVPVLRDVAGDYRADHDAQFGMGGVLGNAVEVRIETSLVAENAKWMGHAWSFDI